MSQPYLPSFSSLGRCGGPSDDQACCVRQLIREEAELLASAQPAWQVSDTWRAGERLWREVGGPAGRFWRPK